jgi:hypothetical protein
VCGHDCSRPPSQFISVDSSSCARRAWQVCSDGITAQSQLDASLMQILTRLDVVVPNENKLVVWFQNGCPTLFVETGTVDPADAAKLRTALASVRLACAHDLECAIADGGSTLQ